MHFELAQTGTWGRPNSFVDFSAAVPRKTRMRLLAVVVGLLAAFAQAAPVPEVCALGCVTMFRTGKVISSKSLLLLEIMKPLEIFNKRTSVASRLRTLGCIKRPHSHARFPKKLRSFSKCHVYHLLRKGEIILQSMGFSLNAWFKIGIRFNMVPFDMSSYYKHRFHPLCFSSRQRLKSVFLFWSKLLFIYLFTYFLHSLMNASHWKNWHSIKKGAMISMRL